MPRESDLGHARLSLSRGSLSGDLLGKFSAIVRPRRPSHVGDNNGGADGVPILDSTDDTSFSAVDPSSFSDGEGTTPSAPKAFGFMRRFSRATTPFSMVTEESSSSSAMTLRCMLGGDEPERQRRYELEVMSFAMLHDHFQPRHGLAPEVEEDENDPVDDNQVEEELQRAMDSSGDDDASDDGDQDDEEPVRRKSRETTTDADEYAALHDDEDRALLVLRLKSRANMDASASHADDDHDDDDDDDDLEDEDTHDQGSGHADDGELNFDPEHLPSSVRTLVRQIENASFLDVRDADAAASGASGTSNQDDEGHLLPKPQQCPTEDRDVMTAKESYAPRHSDPLAHAKAPSSRRITYPMVTNHNHFRAPPPAQPSAVPFLGHMGQNCYIPMDEVQEDLTKSVRRLVIGLQQEAEGHNHNQQHNANANAQLPFTRRRGNSCPQPFCSPPTRASAAAEPMASISAPTPPPMPMDMGPSPAEPPRWRKRSTLARLAPKFLDTFRRKRKSYLYTDEELESIEGARWKIVELAFRFGGKHRAYLVQAVNMFFPLIKYGRHGGPHATRLHCNRCGTLQWQHKRGGLSDAVDLADVLQIIEGRQTAVFRKYVSCQELDARSLSLIFKDRTLDLETQGASHRDWLMSALRTLVAYAKKQRQAEHRAIAEHALLSLDDLSESSASTQSRVELLARVHDGSNVTNHGSGAPVLLW